jgi:hypothetical protein
MVAAAALICDDGVTERAREGMERRQRAREELRASFYRQRGGGGTGRGELDGHAVNGDRDEHAQDGEWGS